MWEGLQARSAVGGPSGPIPSFPGRPAGVSILLPTKGRGDGYPRMTAVLAVAWGKCPSDAPTDECQPLGYGPVSGWDGLRGSSGPTGAMTAGRRPGRSEGGQDVRLSVHRSPPRSMAGQRQENPIGPEGPPTERSGTWSAGYAGDAVPEVLQALRGDLAAGAELLGEQGYPQLLDAPAKLVDQRAPLGVEGGAALL